MALDKLLQLANIAYIVCVVIVAAMTFVIYHLSARVNADKDRELEKYRTESTIKITAAQAEAEEARKIAESERLARAELESQIAAAEVRAAEANAVASQARLELAKLKEPRNISPENQEKIIVALKEFAGQNFCFSVFPDPEPLALLRVIDTVLKSAGWLRVPSQIGAVAVDAAGNTAGTAHDSGVTAFVGPDNRDAVAALLTLSRALNVAGIPCQSSKTEQLRDKTPQGYTHQRRKEAVVEHLRCVKALSHVTAVSSSPIAETIFIAVIRVRSHCRERHALRGSCHWATGLPAAVK